ncbi:MAG: hypothetical protein R3234_05355, partial [Thermoanaerobaculia bacterium]|nr:hypothetical protein [Thermoanaerobaculia bacterium]
RVAIELAREADATGDYPKDLRSSPRSPYTGSTLTLTPSGKGGVVLSVPGADELWEEGNRTRPETRRPPFSWRLPPV